MARKLKLWNGRGYIIAGYGKYSHAYLCAYSRADAARMIQEYAGRHVAGVEGELRDYFAECWGRAMDGITPERGIWLQDEMRGTPVRVYPRQATGEESNPRAKE